MELNGRLAAFPGLGVGADAANGSAPDAALSLEELAIATLALQLLLAAIALAGARLSRQPVAVRLRLGPSRLEARELALLALGMLAFSACLDGILDVSGLRGSSVLEELDAQLTGLRGGALALALASIALAPGIAEELLCRGLIQTGLVVRLGVGPGIAIAALCFGALHVDPVHAVFAAALGVYLGAAAQLAHSTRASMLCHIVNNAMAVLGGAWGIGAGFPSSLAIPLGLAGATLCLAVVTARVRRRTRVRPPLDGSE